MNSITTTPKQRALSQDAALNRLSEPPSHVMSANWIDSERTLPCSIATSPKVPWKMSRSGGC